MTLRFGHDPQRLAGMIAFAVLVLVMPPAMVVANRASAAMLALACAVFLTGWSLAGRPTTAMRPRSKGITDFVSTHPFVTLYGVFLLHAAISLPFTADPEFHARRLLEFAIPVLVTAGMLWLMQRLPLQTSFWIAAAGLTLCALLVLIELRADAPLRRLLQQRLEDFRLNRTAVTLVLMTMPVVGLAIIERRPRAALLVVLVSAIAIALSQSGAAVLGALVAALTLALAILHWRAAWVASIGAVALILASAPFLGYLLYDLIPPSVHQHLASTSSAIRVDIWRAFGAAVQHAPIFGSGFNTAARFDIEPGIAVVPLQWHPLFDFKHAHNAALQIWVELGAFGALTALAISIMTLIRIGQGEPRLRPVMLAAFNASFAIAIVSHGAWQAWWAGLIGTLAVLFVAMNRRAKDSAIT